MICSLFSYVVKYLKALEPRSSLLTAIFLSILDRIKHFYWVNKTNSVTLNDTDERIRDNFRAA